ncbi:hypothetical protein DdX_08799 [Ditylenchus destructor]|uniref:Uncharacterized protein n=1 Tax=Ditylenchus destructor TaxID=166010 RepID=A0AAD4R6P5_9BILA|nr:hypothetical protein DdX_08799 [Ditylenchus destructor]
MKFVDHLLNAHVDSLLFDQPDGEYAVLWVVGRSAAIYAVHWIAWKLQVSEDNTCVLTYPTIRLFDILFRKRHIYSWKKELKALIRITTVFFLVEVLSKLICLAIITLLSNQVSATSVSEMLWWLIFVVSCTPLVWRLLEHPLMDNPNDEVNEGA